MKLKSWFRKGAWVGEEFDSYACAEDTPMAAAAMRRDGYMTSDESIDELITVARQRTWT